MVKEFCVKYELHESSEYTNRKVYTVKVKTDEDILEQEVMLDDIDGYKKALKALGYTERICREELTNQIDDCKVNIDSLKEDIEHLTFILRKYSSMESCASHMLSIGEEYFCDWW